MYTWSFAANRAGVSYGNNPNVRMLRLEWQANYPLYSSGFLAKVLRLRGVDTEWRGPYAIASQLSRTNLLSRGCWFTGCHSYAYTPLLMLRHKSMGKYETTISDWRKTLLNNMSQQKSHECILVARLFSLATTARCPRRRWTMLKKVRRKPV